MSGSGTSYNSRNSAFDYFPPERCRLARSLATSPWFDGQNDEQTSITLTEEWITNERRTQQYHMHGYVDSEASTRSRTLSPTLSNYNSYILPLVAEADFTNPFYPPGLQAHHPTPSSITLDRRSTSRLDYQGHSFVSVTAIRRQRSAPASSGSSTSSSPGPVSPAPPSASQWSKYTMHAYQQNYTPSLLRLPSQTAPPQNPHLSQISLA